MHQLNDVSVQRVPVFLQETYRNNKTTHRSMARCNMARMCPASSPWVAGLLAVLGEVMGVISGQREGDQEKEETHLETGSKMHVVQSTATLSWAHTSKRAPNSAAQRHHCRAKSLQPEKDYSDTTRGYHPALLQCISSSSPSPEYPLTPAVPKTCPIPFVS